MLHWSVLLVAVLLLLKESLSTPIDAGSISYIKGSVYTLSLKVAKGTGRGTINPLDKCRSCAFSLFLVA